MHIYEYINIDESDIWTKIKNSSNEDCKAIFERNHIRMVHQTSENPDEKELELLNKILKIFDEHHIEYHKETLSHSWYKFGDKESNFEIMIIDEKKNMYPLSTKSQLVRNLKKFNQTKIFISPKNGLREKADEIIKEIRS